MTTFILFAIQLAFHAVVQLAQDRMQTKINKEPYPKDIGFRGIDLEYAKRSGGIAKIGSIALALHASAAIVFLYLHSVL